MKIYKSPKSQRSLSLHRKIQRHSIQYFNLKFIAPNEISVAFPNGSKYDCYFIIKELANEIEGQFEECIAENKGKYKTFSVPIKKEIRKIDKEGDQAVETISYKIKFIDSARFMKSSLSNFVVHNLTGFIKLNVKIVIVFLNINVSRVI